MVSTVSTELLNHVKSQKHANDSHLYTAIIKGDSPIRYLLVKEKADLRSESHSQFQYQGDIYYSLYPSLAFGKGLQGC